MDKIKKEEIVQTIYGVSHKICDIDLEIFELVKEKELLQARIKCLRHRIL